MRVHITPLSVIIFLMQVWCIHASQALMAPDLVKQVKKWHAVWKQGGDCYVHSEAYTPVSGFGSFRLARRPARQGINPVTKQRVPLSPIVASRISKSQQELMTPDLAKQVNAWRAAWYTPIYRAMCIFYETDRQEWPARYLTPLAMHDLRPFYVKNMNELSKIQ